MSLLLKDCSHLTTSKQLLPVYREVASHLGEFQYPVLSDILSKVDTTQMSTVLLVGLPRLTCQWKHDIDCWQEFLDKCCAELDSRGEDYKQLMRGLI